MATLLASGTRVRIHSVPTYEPPLAEHADQAWTLPQPTLRLNPSAPRNRAPAPAPAPPPAPPVTADPATRTAAVRFVHTCLEIFNGYRPVAHARSLAHPLAAPQVLEAMTYATRRLARATGGAAGRSRVRLQRMRVCQPRAGIAEVSVVIGTAAGSRCGARSWAAAFRLEQHQGRWRCTVARVL